jgi:hypothetical protein
MEVLGMKYPWNGSATRDIRDSDFSRAAGALDCDVAAIRAVWEVEAAGRPFLGDGTLIRRFEPHHFPERYWSLIGFDPAGTAPWRASLNIGTADRDRMLGDAYRADSEAACRATSWGAPQIMGFNHAEAGHGSAVKMVQKMADRESAHLTAFVDLIKSWGLAGALRAHDWTAFARRYNGSGQVAEYARRMESAYRRHSGGQASPTVLRVGDRGEAVRRLQRMLHIEVDGVFGPETLQAVQRFQSASGLAVDGIVGNLTWKALTRHEELHGRPVADPPKQDSTVDYIEREAGRWTAIISAVAAAATGFSQALSGLPDIMIWAMVAGVAIGGAIWWWKNRGRS